MDEHAFHCIEMIFHFITACHGRTTQYGQLFDPQALRLLAAAAFDQPSQHQCNQVKHSNLKAYR
jgi:hypothetical protein